MKNENLIWLIVGISVLLFFFGGFSMMGFGGWGSNWMGGMMYGYNYGGMWLFGWLFMTLITVALVLFIINGRRNKFRRKHCVQMREMWMVI